MPGSGRFLHYLARKQIGPVLQLPGTTLGIDIVKYARKKQIPIIGCCWGDVNKNKFKMNVHKINSAQSKIGKAQHKLQML